MRGLVLSIDDSYVMPFKVLWHSLIKTESIPPETPVFILHADSLSSSSIRDLQLFVEKYNRTLLFLDSQELIGDNLPVSRHVSKATYYRLYVASMLPESISSVVYLDSDAVVVRSLRALFEIPLDQPLAAADHFSLRDSFRLWGDKSGTYFQAGVLVIDLIAWRSSHIEATFSSILANQSDRITWWDQDVLNIAFENQWQRLPIWYNVPKEVRRELGSDAVLQNMCYLHYDGEIKPWLFEVNDCYGNEWYQAYQECFGSAFDKSKLLNPNPPPSPTVVIKSYLRRIAGKFKLR